MEEDKAKDRKERQRDHNRQFYERNRERIRAQQKQYYQQHREHLKKLQYEYYHSERGQQVRKEWKKNNREKINGYVSKGKEIEMNEIRAAIEREAILVEQFVNDMVFKLQEKQLVLCKKYHKDAFKSEVKKLVREKLDKI